MILGTACRRILVRTGPALSYEPGVQHLAPTLALMTPYRSTGELEGAVEGVSGAPCMTGSYRVFLSRSLPDRMFATHLGCFPLDAVSDPRRGFSEL